MSDYDSDYEDPYHNADFFPGDAAPRAIPPGGIYGGEIQFKPPKKDIDRPENAVTEAFLADYIGKEGFEIIQSLSHKCQDDLFYEEIELIETWNHLMSSTNRGTRFPEGFYDSIYADRTNTVVIENERASHRTSFQKNVKIQIHLYRKALACPSPRSVTTANRPKGVATKNTPKSVTTRSKSDSPSPEISSYNIESISTVSTVDMASTHKDENQGPAKEPVKLAQGLSDSIYAKGGDFNTKSRGPSKELLKSTQVQVGPKNVEVPSDASPNYLLFLEKIKGTEWGRGGKRDIFRPAQDSTARQDSYSHMGNKSHEPSISASKENLNQPSAASKENSYQSSASASKNAYPQSGYDGPTFVRPQRSSALSIKNPVTNEVVDVVAWKSSSGSRSPSPSSPCQHTQTSSPQIQEPSTIQQVVPKVQQPIIQQAPRMVKQAVVQQALSKVQQPAVQQSLPKVQQRVVQQVPQKAQPVAIPQVSLKAQGGVAENKSNGRPAVAGTTGEHTADHWRKFASVAARLAHPIAVQQVPRQTVVDNTLPPVSIKKANIMTGQGKTNQQSTLSLASIKKTNVITEQGKTIQQSTQVSQPIVTHAVPHRIPQPLVTPYVPPHLRGFDGLPCQKLIDFDEETRKRRAAGLLSTSPGTSFQSSEKHNSMKFEQESITGPQQFQKSSTPVVPPQGNLKIVANTCVAVHPEVPTQKPITEVSHQVALAEKKAIATGTDQAGAHQQQPVEKAPVADLFAALIRPAGFWPNPCLEMLRRDLVAQAQEDLEVSQISVPDVLTANAMMIVYGSKPRENDPTNFDDKISDDGVAKEVIRAAQGADELKDWDGTWAPGPCDWENERPQFNGSFVPDYIREWREDLPAGPEVAVDTSTVEFSMAKEAINNGIYEIPDVQPDCIPDIGNASDELKRVNQTASNVAHNYLIAYEKREQRMQKNQRLINNQAQEIMARAPERNPFSPKIPLYMRPVEEKDAAGVAEIYNYWIQNSILTEDTEELTLQDAVELIRASKSQKLPFIVSISGCVPSMTDVQGRRGVSQQSMLPQVEKVIGFAFSERFNCSLSAKFNGRSRFTSTLQVYVHPQYTRKGVGRNLMDRLVHSITRSYAYKGAAEWINPRNDRINETEGSGTWHQMLINVPILKSDDQTLTWLTSWLYDQNSFWFKEHYRMKSVGRTNQNTGSPALWIDVAVFQCEATHGDVFGPYE